MNSEKRKWRWKDDAVDPTHEHIELRYGNASNSDYEDWIPIAIIGKPRMEVFPVQWLVNADSEAKTKMIAEARDELNFYLVELSEPNPWAYAVYHCSTAANIYSRIH